VKANKKEEEKEKEGIRPAISVCGKLFRLLAELIRQSGEKIF
jgi:hypothetical protein